MTDFTKLSDITRFTVQAVEEAEAHPECEVNMGTYHDHDGEFCIACAAGYAAIKRWAGSVNPVRVSGIAEFAESFELGRDDVERFEYAVDGLRTGWPSIAATYLSIKPMPKMDRRIPSYYRAPKEWKAAMLKMADDLEAEGF